MAKILIVDDDPAIRQALNIILTRIGHVSTEVEDGLAAQKILQSDEFALVISDFQMPGMNGLDLLKWIKANKKIPVILITAFSHILETQQAFDLGADDFFAKPFNYKDILKAVEKIISPKSLKAKEPVIDEQGQYCQVPIEDFISNAGVQISIYIRLSEHKYVCVAHKGDVLPADRIESYKQKGVTSLFARKDEFAKLVGFNLDFSKIKNESKSESEQNKFKFLRYSAEMCFEKALVGGVDTNAFRQATDCLNICLSIVTESQSLYEILEMLNKHADWLYIHSLGVSLYSIMIGRKMGWAGQATLFKLSTAGLFHDIGEKEIDVATISKSRVALSFDERKSIETHPTRSKEILQNIKEISDDIVQIVYEHHEDRLGQGYPRQLTKERIHPLAKIVNVADLFCSFALPGPRGPGGNAKQALSQMNAQYGDKLDRPAMTALKELCN
jgi:response regulator RpfG family c-di-GMP phosphodiesterase